jgi:UDP-N-acetylmuramoyl-L-alanyl-D-glutamate--2,6-diaminopimelate ligase
MTIRHGMNLDRLLAGFAQIPASTAVSVTGMALDSRQVHEGDLFCALVGEHGHGLDHARQAVARGAAAVIFEPVPQMAVPDLSVPAIAVPALNGHISAIAARFFGDPSAAVPIIGVTGTNGKSSCVHLLAQTLSVGEQACGMLGTLGYGFLNSLQPATHTTPDAITVQAQLARLRAAGARWVAMEVSSHGLAQRRVEAVRFHIALFTNLSRDHLDYHQDLDAYFAAKQRLFTWPGLAAAIVNGDDARAEALLQTVVPASRKVRYGLQPQSSEGVDDVLWAQAVRPRPEGLEISVTGSWGEAHLRTPLMGVFNASNVLAVLAVLLVAGVPLRTAAERLSRVHPVPGRMARHGGHGKPTVVVDYAHTPDALDKALRACRQHAAGELWCVFGCGGDRDRGKRAQMGAIAARLADHLILTDDNPRSEVPAAIIADIQAGLPVNAGHSVIHDRAAAIAYALACARPGDVVLVAGKGHEDYQIVGARRLPFSDTEQVIRHLQEYRA